MAFDPFKDGGAVAVQDEQPFDPFKAGAIPAEADISPTPETDKAVATTADISISKRFETPLNPQEEKAFQGWKIAYAPRDSGMDYDLRGAFKAGITPDPVSGHWPDTFKKPNHPTFSDQSIYAKDAPERAGRWVNGQYIPPIATSRMPATDSFAGIGQSGRAFLQGAGIPTSIPELKEAGKFLIRSPIQDVKDIYQGITEIPSKVSNVRQTIATSPAATVVKAPLSPEAFSTYGTVVGSLVAPEVAKRVGGEVNASRIRTDAVQIPKTGDVQETGTAQSSPNLELETQRQTISGKGAINEETQKRGMETQGAGQEKALESPLASTAESAAASVPVSASAAEPRLTGISQAMHEERGSGVEPGIGAGPEEMINAGRQEYHKGADPEPIAQKIDKGEGVNAIQTGILRAHIEELSKKSAQAQDLADANPDNTKLQEDADHAFNAETAWRERIKPAATEWQKVGATMQGATDIDTGSFTGLKRAVQEEHGRDLTPQEVPQARKIATDISKTDQQINQTKQKLYQSVDQMMLKLDDEPSFKGRNPNEIKAIWEHAKKNYIDNGESSFEDMIHGTAQDLGLSSEQVRDVIAGPKSTRVITDEMYGLMSKRRRATQQAQSWVKGLNDPKIKKIWDAVTHLPFSVAVAGHVVGMETHAGANKFNLSGWKPYWTNVGRQYKLFGSPAFHEKMMQGIEKDPQYYFWKRAGLGIDPKVAYDPYQQYARWGMGKLGEAGSRAMDVLKIFRLEEAKRQWSETPSNLRKGDYAKELASNINKASGAGDARVLGGASKLMFAAKLFASRWGRIIGSPKQTIADWVSGDPSRVNMAKLRTRRAAEFGAVYLSTLAANQALLSAMGSDSKVNFTDPTKPDFWKHKIAGKAVDLTGNLLDPIRFLSAIVAFSIGTEPPRGETRFQAMGDYATRYARGKLNPFFGIITDVGVRRDFTGRPMPEVPGLPTEKEKPGKPAYTWPEYLLEQRGPIPVSGGIREISDTWREKGMTNAQIDDYLRALAVFGTEATGVKVSPEYKPKAQSSGKPSRQFGTPLSAKWPKERALHP